MPLFNMAFAGAARALMMGSEKRGVSLSGSNGCAAPRCWILWSGAAIIRSYAKTRRIIEDYWDLPGTELILNKIRSGGIRVLEMRLESPPLCLASLRRRTERAMMYDYAPTPSESMSQSRR